MSASRRVANNLRTIRRSCGLAGWGLAVQAGVSPATIVAVEKHGHRPGQDTQQRIASALGVSVADIWPPLSAELQEGRYASAS